MSSLRTSLLLTATLAFVLLGAGPALAQDGEIAFVIGALMGDELEFDDIDEVDDEIGSSFDNSPLYGGRLGIYGHPWGLEGSVVVSPSGLSSDDSPTELDVRVIYAEGNVLLIPIPGPVSPFATGGVGIHSYKFEGGGLDITENRLGFNFGGGVKANIGPVSLRGDVRDHVTPFDRDDLDAVLVPILGLEDDETLHNWEISASVGFRF